MRYALSDREIWIGNYGKKSDLLSLYLEERFQITKSAGPAGYYCYGDVNFCAYQRIWHWLKACGDTLNQKNFFARHFYITAPAREKFFE